MVVTFIIQMAVLPRFEKQLLTNAQTCLTGCTALEEIIRNVNHVFRL